jgi:flagellar basal body-associated protein FliL
MTSQNELPSWSVKKQKAYKISRILWIAQIILALLASVGIIGIYLL